MGCAALSAKEKLGMWQAEALLLGRHTRTREFMRDQRLYPFLAMVHVHAKP